MNQWQPRFGFAWSFTPKTVLRGGFGLYYSFANEHNTTTGFNQRTDVSSSVDGGLTPNPRAPLSNPFPDGAAPSSGASAGLLTAIGRGIGYDGPTRRIPRAREWSFGIQRELPGHILLDTEYVGSHTDRMRMGTQWDTITEAQRAQGQADPAFLDTRVTNPFFGILPRNSSLGSSSTIAAWQLMRPYPEFDGTFENTNPGAKAFYNSLQVRAEKRVGGGGIGRGLTFIMSYTWSHEFEQNHYLNNGAFRDDKPIYETAFFDRTHNLAFSGVWDLPFGQGGMFASNASGVLGGLINHWAFDWIFTAASGVPTGWPDAVFSCGDYKVPNPSFDRWLNNDTSCYKNRPPWSKRVVPDRFNWIRNHYEPQLSVALQKQFAMTERFRMQARVEGFNVTNTPIFPGPNLNFNDKPRQEKDGIWRGFGTVALEQQNFPRNIQVSLKLIF